MPSSKNCKSDSRVGPSDSRVGHIVLMHLMLHPSTKIVNFVSLLGRDIASKAWPKQSSTVTDIMFKILLLNSYWHCIEIDCFN